MTTHLGLQRILLPSAQVSQLTTGSITLPSARGTFTTNITLAYYALGGGGTGGGGGFTNNGSGAGGGGHSYSASTTVVVGTAFPLTVGSTASTTTFSNFTSNGGANGVGSTTPNVRPAGGTGNTQSGGDGGEARINSTPGSGGAGYTNPIDSVARGGGGGGASKTSGNGNGADGGTGGVSGNNISNPNPAAAGSGGGGGGISADNLNGSLGGSGRIIFKIPDTNNASFSGGVTANSNTAGGFKTIQVTAAGANDTVTFG